MEGKVIYDVFHLVYWDVKIALDLFFGGIGVGAYLFAVFVSIYYKDEHKQVSKVGAYIAPISVMIGLVFLFLELEHPERVFLFYTNFSFGSPLSWGAWFQGIFILISIGYAYLWYKDKGKSDSELKLRRSTDKSNSGDNGHISPKSSQRKLIGYIGIPFAIIVGGYHGFLLTIVKSKPIWYGGPSTITAIIGFILTGIAAIILILSLSKNAKVILSSIKLSRNILGVAIIGQLFTLYLWVISMQYGPFSTDRAIDKFVDKFELLFWGGVVVLGLLIPLIIGVYATIKERKSKEHKLNIAIPIITSILVLIGGLLLKYTWVIGGQLF